MSAHTPGPWIVCEAHKGFVISNDKNNYDIAVVRNIGSQNNEANAHLIAAAPELLDALLMVLDDPNALDGRPRTAEYVKASIAKATGENE